MAAKFEIRSPKAGQFRWVLTSQGRTLATGETYSRRVSAEKAIGSLQAATATATIDDTTIKAPTGKSVAAKAARDSGRSAGKTTPKKKAKRATKTAAQRTSKPTASSWGRKPAGAKPAAKQTTARNTKTAKAPPRQRTARTS
jgi:uncharacterized protein YegP (UPF0339 family)